MPDDDRSTEDQIAESEERSRIEIGKASDLAEDRNVSLEGRATGRVNTAKGEADTQLQQSEGRSSTRTDRVEARLSDEIHVLRESVVELADKHEAQDELLRRKGILIRRGRIYSLGMALVIVVMGWQIVETRSQKECLQRYTMRVNDAFSSLILSGIEHRDAQRGLLNNPPTSDPDRRRHVLGIYFSTLDESDRSAYALLDQIDRDGNC